MAFLDVPVELSWRLPDELAAAVHLFPYKLTLAPRGERGVAVTLTILPPGTIEFVPLKVCTCCPEHGPPVVRPITAPPDTEDHGS